MTIILNGTTGVTFPNGVTMSDGTSAPVTVAQGGTGANTASDARTSLGTNDAANITTGTLAVARGGTGTNATTFCNLTSNVAGTLPVANGGTGATTLTANNVLLGNGTSALQAVAPGSNGNILTSNGTTWVSSAPAAGGVTSVATGNGLSGGTITSTGTLTIAAPSFNSIGSYILAANQDNNVTYGNTYSASNQGVRIFNSTWNSVSCNTVLMGSSGIQGVLSGTWRAMSSAQSQYAMALYVRVS